MAGLMLLLPLSTALADTGAQSTFAKAGVEATRVESLFWIMVAVGALVWLAVVALALLAGRKERAMPRRHVKKLVIAGGVLLPLLMLTPLLFHGLTMLSTLRTAPADLRITVVGERWWWRIAYDGTAGQPAIVLANEIRLPVGKTVALSMTTPEVLHSLWIPALGGKLDLIPGRTTELRLQPTKVGLFRGVCAEYCGVAHGQMAFMVEVMEPAAFAGWLEQQGRPAVVPTANQAAAGQQQFQRNGCQGCHSIRGTAAAGLIGPDLTHVGSRHSLAAAALPNGTASLQRWLSKTHQVKPGNLMPHFGHLPSDDIAAISAYLESLQ